MNRLFFKSFIIRVVASILLLFIAFCVIDFVFKKYTRHDHIVCVPSLIGLDLMSSHDTLVLYDLDLVVLDSTTYNPIYARGAVISHTPNVGSIVKPGRKIYVTMNPKKVNFTSFPSLKDKSIRQSIAILENSFFRIGDLFYVDDFARDVVKFAQLDGKNLLTNDSLPKFSIIDLYLGNGYDYAVEVPELINTQFFDLKKKLNNYSLNLGQCYFDNSVIDSLNAFVYKTLPTYGDTASLGSYINIWLTDTINDNDSE